MNKFGLACEGITDHIVLENILCGYFEDPDLDENITRLQPHLDETDQKQANFGGWEMLVDYLKSLRFREDVVNVKYLVLQLDTDIIEHPNFGLSYQNIQGEKFTIKEIIESTIIELISKIDSGEVGFYEKNKDKVIFALCVHSLECWLYAHYNNKLLKSPKITGCGKALEYTLKESGFDKSKDKKLYEKYSKVFLERKNIDQAANKDPSFKYFIQLLEKSVQ